MFDKSVFGARVLALRKSSGFSQQVIAEHLGISFHQVSKMETGQRGPSLEVACALADFFNVSLDYLVGRSDDPERR